MIILNTPSFHICLNYRMEYNMKMCKLSSMEMNRPSFISVTLCNEHQFKYNHYTRSSNRFHRWNYSNDKSKYSLRYTGPAL